MSSAACTPLPISLSTKHRRSVWEFISDVKSGVETGEEKQLFRYCPEEYIRDSYIPPNLDFSNCFLHNNTTPINASSPSLKKFITSSTGKATQSEVVSNVLLLVSKLQHSVTSHSVVASAINFQKCRTKPYFKINQLESHQLGNSVFISTSMVHGLIKHTVSAPDKITRAKYSSDRFLYERAYKTEIGHNANGCCHVVRVVVQRCQNPTLLCQGVLYELVTAFPTQSFSPN